MLVEEVQPETPVALEMGRVDSTAYGNGFEGATDFDGVLEATFEATGEDLRLRFLGYDIDNATELEILLNGSSLGLLAPGGDGALAAYEVLLDADRMLPGQNTISFVQTGSPSYTWGITELRIDPAPATFVPADDRYAEQWYLRDIGRIEQVWADYTGAGVAVGVYDDGLQWSHPDLNDNYDPSRHVVFDGTVLDPATGGATHGTAVAGLIAAEADGSGIVGTAFGAKLTGLNMITGIAGAGSTDLTAFVTAMEAMTRFDVVNHSWGSTPGFDSTPEALAFFAAALPTFAAASEDGRGGLGTILVKSAGNDAANSQGDLLDASRHSITVAASTDSGDAASYSNYGANVLVSAPSSGDLFSGQGVLTTDVTGAEGYTGGNYTGTDPVTGFGGTSAAAPLVSGVVALMLEANPALGWRDVHDILAHSARHSGLGIGEDPGSGIWFILFPADDPEWAFNGAQNWNGGGLHFSEDFGYGDVHVNDAVRMAEVWHLFDAPQTSANEVVHSVASDLDVSVIGSTSLTFDLSGVAMDVEAVELSLSLSDPAVSVTLTSAAGTQVELLSDTDAPAGPLEWSFGAQAFRGEAANGIWTLDIRDANLSATTLFDYEISWFGAAPSTGGDDTYHYTDEIFADILFDAATDTATAIADDAARTLLSDADGGSDWLNRAAMPGDLSVDLAPGAISRSSGREVLTIDAGSVIENGVAGDGHDTLSGNDADNELRGMRGNDILQGGAGADTLYGGAGDDVFVFAPGAGLDRIEDFAEGDRILLSGYDGRTFDSLAFVDDGAGNTLLDMGAGDRLVLAGTAALSVGAQDVLFDDLYLV